MGTFCTTDNSDKDTIHEAVTIMAHEIKNPLSAALANLTLIRESDKEQNYTQYCQIIERELYRINQLVIDLIHIGLPDEWKESSSQKHN